MATPAQLVRTIADALGVPETTVTTHDRNLAKSGLRTVGGRGTGAAKMTSRDAAHLLIAVASSAPVKDSVMVVERYQGCKSVPIRRIGEDIPACKLQLLPENHSIIDLIESIIESYIYAEVVEEFDSLILPVETMSTSGAQDVINITFTLSEPYDRAKVELFPITLQIDEENSEYFKAEFHDKIQYFYSNPSVDASYNHDLKHEHSFTDRTIRIIGNLLRDT